tara:strand:+ start:515 stop:670 length:156 start_codon:yes stop_codon:yes gene_type:complete
MNIRIIIVLLLLLLSCSDNKFSWYDGTFDNALNQVSTQKDKILFLDFYSDN